MKRPLLAILLAALSASFLLQSPSYAQPIFNATNGHWYELVPLGTQPPLNWNEAQAFAASRSVNGRSGYLATITNSSENQFILDNVFSFTPQGQVDIWIGGHQLNNQPALNAGWQWVTTGEPWSFSYWLAGEPNDCCATYMVEDNEENCLEYKYDGSWGWNDCACSAGLSFLLVEYDGESSPVGAPTMTELGMIILVILLGTGSVCNLRRRAV